MESNINTHRDDVCTQKEKSYLKIIKCCGKNHLIMQQHRRLAEMLRKKRNEIKDIWSRYAISKYTLWRDKHWYTSFILIMTWQFVCLFVWPLKQKDNVEFLHSLLPYINATYSLKYYRYTKQSAEQWLQPERTSTLLSAAQS